MNHHRIAIIGTGNVGATTAYTLLQQNAAAELLLVDANEDLCCGHVLDLNDALTTPQATAVRQATMAEARDADIIVIAAGRPQKVGESRLALCTTNRCVLETILQSLKPINPHAILIIVTNPVDVLTTIALTSNILPKQQIFGTGTALDVQRLKRILAQKYGVADQSVQALVIGEHGDAQIIPWQYVQVAGISVDELKLSTEERKQIERMTREQAYHIIEKKCATYFGIAACVANICAAIMHNQKLITPVSWLHEGYEGCINLPIVLGAQGIERTVPLQLTELQKQALSHAAWVVADSLRE